jgi:uncharacterized protein (TIGR02391 family)
MAARQLPNNNASLSLARSIVNDVASLPIVAARSSKPSLDSLYDTVVKSIPIRSATRKLFVDGHHAEAVEEAYKCLNNLVKAKSGMYQRDGPDLMLHVFDADRPVLRLNHLRTTSERDEQAGYRFIFAGCMTGIRNPRAHGHDLSEDPEIALELLAWANHLARIIEGTTRTRARKAATAQR